MNRANITVTISTLPYGWKMPKKGESEKRRWRQSKGSGEEEERVCDGDGYGEGVETEREREKENEEKEIRERFWKGGSGEKKWGMSRSNLRRWRLCRSIYDPPLPNPIQGLLH